MNLKSYSYLVTTMRVEVGQMVHVKNVDLAQIHLLAQIDLLHPFHIIPIDRITKSCPSSAVQFVILSIIATT